MVLLCRRAITTDDVGGNEFARREPMSSVVIDTFSSTAHDRVCNVIIVIVVIVVSVIERKDAGTYNVRNVR